MAGEGAQKLQTLLQGGFTPQEAQDWRNRTAATLEAGGFSQDEITDYFGEERQNPDVGAAVKPMVDRYLALAGGADPAKLGVDLDSEFQKFAEAGWQHSVTSLLRKAPSAEVDLEHAGLRDRMTYQLSQMIGDVPAMAAGAAIGAAEGGGIASAVTAFGGAAALPAGMRRVMMEKYASGEIQSPQRFLEVASAATIDAFNQYVVGAATGAAGVGGKAVGEAVGVAAKVNALPGAAILPTLAPAVGNYGAQIATMTTLSAALEGHLPRPEDFLDTAIVVGGLGAATHGAAKLRQIYRQTGIGAIEVLDHAAKDPTIVEDVLSKNIETPRAYRAQEAAEAARAPEEILTEEARAQQALEAAKPALTGQAEAPAASEPPTPPAGGGTPYDRVLARLSVGEQAPKPKYTWNQFYTNWVDRFHPLYRVVQAMADGQTLPLLQDAYKLARLKVSSFAKAQHFLESGAFAYGDVRKIVGPAFRKILDPVKDDLDGLRVYLASRRALEYQRRGLESGINPVDAAAAEAQLRPKFQKVASDLYAYQDHVLRYLKDGGFLDDARYAEMKKLNQDFVPFHRLFEEEGTKGAGRGLRVLQPLRKVKGGDQTIVDPLESVVKNTHFLIELAERNRVARTFVELAETSARGSDFAQKKAGTARPVNLTETERKALVDQVLQGQPLTQAQEASLADDFAVFRRDPLTAGRDEIAIYREGKREVWQVTPELWKVFEGSAAAEAGILRKILEKPASFLRAGSVLSPEFIARNVPRDLMSAFVFADGVFSPINTMKGFFSVIAKDETYRLWQRSGGAMAELVSLDREYLQGNLKELVEKHGAYEKTRNVVRNPIEALRILSEISEQSTRVGVFQKALRRGATPEEAALASREGTLDFNRAGVKAIAVNRLVAFFNAQIQGLDKVVRTFADKPLETTAKTLAGITLPSVALYLLNRDEEGWSEIPQWQKDLFWLVKAGDTWWRIPKPFELGVIFGSGAERMAAALVDHDPHAFDGFLQTLYRGATPNVVPTAAIPVAEAWANRSLFMDRPLIPSRYEKILPDFQSQPYTKELTKAIGSAIARIPGMQDSIVASPLVIENTIRGWTGGLGMHILRLANAALTKAGLLPEPLDPTPTLADLPLIGGFAIRYPSLGANSIQNFYDHYGEQEKIRGTLDFLDKQGEVDAYEALYDRTGGGIDLTSWGEALSELSAIYRATWRDPELGRDEKRQALDELTFEMIEIAKDGNHFFEEAQADSAATSGMIAPGTPPQGGERGSTAAEPPTLH